MSETLTRLHRLLMYYNQRWAMLRIGQSPAELAKIFVLGLVSKRLNDKQMLSDAFIERLAFAIERRENELRKLARVRNDPYFDIAVDLVILEVRDLSKVEGNPNMRFPITARSDLMDFREEASIWRARYRAASADRRRHVA